MITTIVANWKMNMGYSDMIQLTTSLSIINPESVSLIVAPSSCYLHYCATHLPHARICAQAISEYEHGAYTGDISAEMVQSCGARYALIGHSERRALFGETAAAIEKKLMHCRHHQLTPILCVGETMADRESNQTHHVISEQLSPMLTYPGDYLIAYEPVWAIGTGQTATPAMANEVHAWIHDMVGDHVPVLYGGSVTPDTAPPLLCASDINGVLVGSASLSIPSITAIINAAKSIEVTS